MTLNKDEKEPKIKFVDKRRITEEGDIRNIDEQKEEPAKVKDQEINSKEEKEPLKIDFSLFVQSLAHQAMVGLGLVPWPDSGLIKFEPNLAKQNIDIITILKEKTKNNLTKEEENLLNMLAYQLQIAYTEALNKPSNVQS